MKNESSVADNLRHTDCLASPVRTLFQQVREATVRVGALRAPSAIDSQDRRLNEALLELDCAHEELRTAEEYLHAQADAITHTHSTMESELRKYRDLLDAADVGYVLTDLGGLILEANQCAAAMMNISPVFVLGKPLLTFCAKEDMTAWLDALALSARTDQVTRLELRFQPRAGASPIWTEVRTSRVVDSEGVTSLRWLIRNIHETKEIQLLMQERTVALERECATRSLDLESTTYLLRRSVVQEQTLLQQTEQRSDSLHRFLIGVADELCGRLSSVACGLGSIQRERDDGRTLASVARNVRAMTSAVNDVVDYVFAVGRGTRLELEDADVSTLLSQASQACERAATHREISLAVEPVARSIVLRGNKRCWLRAFVNVIAYVLRVTPSRGEVRVATRVEDAHIVIQVHGSPAAEAHSPLPGRPLAVSPSLTLEVARQCVELQGGSLHDNLTLPASIAIRLLASSASLADGAAADPS